MAEFVQMRREQSIPEYTVMRRLNLFDEDEITKIKKTREQYEYKIERHTKQLKDYAEFINYERSLLTIIWERRKTRHIKERKHLEVAIKSKIRGLYKKALARFPEDVRLWDSFVKFCKSFKMFGEVSSILERMLQFHNDKPDVWLRAVFWELTENGGKERARDYLLKALQLHPKCQKLYLAFMKVELNEAKMHKDAEEADSVDKEEFRAALERAKLVYDDAKCHINELEFFLEAFSTFCEFDFVDRLKSQAKDDLLERFAENERFWNQVAQWELNGIRFSDENLTEVDTVSNVKACLEVYEKAVTRLPSKQMWAFYIDAVVELNQDMTECKSLKRKALARAYRNGHNSGLMSERHYVHYLELLIDGSNDEPTLQAVFGRATELHPESSQLWSLLMRYFSLLDEELKLKETFETGLKKVKEPLPLWTKMAQHLQTKCGAEKQMEDLFKRAISDRNSTVANHFKPLYIEWIALKKDLKAARKIYKDLSLNSAPCLEMHQKMSSLEASVVQPDVVAWRQCHEYATHFFGRNDVSVWIDYIRFESEHGDAKSIGNIYERAKKILSSKDLVDAFISEHTLLMMNE